MPQTHKTGICAGLSPRPAMRQAARRAVTAAVEQLEDRTLLSPITFTNGVLTLTGGSTRENHLYIDVSGSQYLVTANGSSLHVTPSALKKIIVNGGPLADRVWINTKVTAPAVVQTLGGNDRISTGNGNDSITAGTGNDIITGCGGNDTITAGDGNDTIYGGSGNDSITTGNGKNFVSGDDGNDTITTGSGSDRIIGGAGNDRLSSGAGDDSLVGDEGNDTLLAGDGNDVLQGGGGSDILDGGAGSNTYPDLSSADMAPSGTIQSSAPQLASVSAGLVPGGVQNLNSTVAGSNHGDSTAPKPVIQIIGAAGAGPHTVFVHALDSTLGAGDPLTTRYYWNFGDTGSRFNSVIGWNAAHTYNDPGKYTVTLTLTNSLGKSSTITTTVTVTADTRRTIYVSTSGSDSNSGLSPNAPIKTVDRAISLMGAGMELLFHAGQTFNVDNTIALPYRDVLVGSYGTGADPILMRVKGTGTSIISMFDNSQNIVVQDLTMDSIWKPVGNIADKMPADGVFADGTDITIRDCTFLNLDNAIDCDRNPAGTLVQDCSAPLTMGIRGYFIWGQGSDQVYIGNTAANSTREHIVRTVGTDRQLIAYNNFTNLNRGSVDVNDSNKGVVDVHRGTYAYVAQNSIRDGELRAGPRGGASDIPGSTTSWTVFEDNYIYDHEIQIYPGTQHLMIRNNVMKSDDGAAINIEPASDGRNILDIRIDNNTATSTGPGGQFLHVYANATPHSISVINNLWIAPNAIGGQHGTAGIYVATGNLNEFSTITHNIWQMPNVMNWYAAGGVMYMWPSDGVQAGFVTPTKWNTLTAVGDDIFSKVTLGSDSAPSSGSIAATAGIAVAGVFDDMNGKLRSLTGKWTVGAVQL